jgi:hypothetical protein
MESKNRSGSGSYVVFLTWPQNIEFLLKAFTGWTQGSKEWKVRGRDVMDQR